MNSGNSGGTIYPFHSGTDDIAKISLISRNPGRHMQVMIYLLMFLKNAKIWVNIMGKHGVREWKNEDPVLICF